MARNEWNDEVKLLLREATRRRGFVVGMFLVLAVAGVAAGLFVPKRYSAHSSVYVEQKNIIGPLMKGTAVQTEVMDRGKIAREVILSHDTMAALAKKFNPGFAGLSPKEQAKRIKELRKHTIISLIGENLIRIEFRDSNPERAAEGAESLARMFVNRSVEAQRAESQAAYDFISSQVGEYKAKMVAAEQVLKAYRANNADLQLGGQAALEKQVEDLTNQLAADRQSLTDAKVRRASYRSQLAGTGDSGAGDDRAQVYQGKIAALKSQVAQLLVNYTSNYPDVITLRGQIHDLETAYRAGKPASYADSIVGTAGAAGTAPAGGNQVQDRLRTALYTAVTDVATIGARIKGTEARLTAASRRLAALQDKKVKLDELVSGYEVKKGLYEELLKRRENARVSMNLDRDKQGLSMKINENASVPQYPDGLSLTQFALIGLGLGLVAPFGMLYGWLQVDRRIRLGNDISERFGVPVVAVVPHYANAGELRADRHAVAGWVGVVVIVGAVALAAAVAHLQGVI